MSHDHWHGGLIGIYCIIAALALMAQKERTVDACERAIADGRT